VKYLQIAPILLVIVAHSATAQNGPSLSVCDLRADPQHYLGKMVTVSGELNSDRHVTLLSSPECDKGVAVVESESLGTASSPLIETFRNGRARTMGCLDYRPFHVSIRGRFGTTKGPLGKIHRVVADQVLSAEFSDGVSQFCDGRIPVVPPPEVKIPVMPPPQF
jgi:hypothetical protein